MTITSRLASWVRIEVLATVAIAMLTVLTACEFETIENPGSSEASESNCLVLESSSVERDAYTSYVVGEVRNRCDRDFDYVQVTISLFDASGNQVGSTLDNVNDLQPNTVWRFRAIILEQEAENYRVTELTGF